MSAPDNAAASADPTEALAERLAMEMAADWRGGDQGTLPRAEDYLVRDRELCLNPSAALRIIYEEICLREEAGEEVSLDELRRRFPRWQAELERLLDYHGALKPAAPPGPLRFPEVGEALGDFRLVAELGRGARGRVFLAAQTSLGERPVVLKVIPADEREHLALARLQHTHIIPINGTQDFPHLGVRALCMPYHGGATLATLLGAVAGSPPGRRTGAELVEALDGARLEFPGAPLPRGPARQFLARASFAQAMCWIGASLADALQYAHERGLVHLDLKPSNVLLTADGQPMLLDFHLACEPIEPGAPPPARIGGTPGSMSPEQTSALAAVRAGRPITRGVDGRSDLYSLGLLLVQALGGDAAADPPGRRPRSRTRLSKRNPQVSPGLEAILRRCLEPDPDRRYPTAAALAGDLRRHLANRPLRGVANRSLRERWRKLRRRQPHAPALAGMLLAVTLAMLAVGANTAAHVVQRHRDARQALSIGLEALGARRHSEAVRELSRGLDIAEGVPGARTLAGELTRQLRIARRAVLADRLHAVADAVRFSYGAEHLARPALQAIRTRCLALWQARDRLLARAGAELEPELERRIATDLAELVVLSGDLGVRLAALGTERPAREEALRMLDEASAVLGPSPLLDRERQVHAEALGLSAVARASGRRVATEAPRTAWETESLGLSLLRAGQYEAAAAEFARALQARPHDFWPNFYAGLCAFRLGRFEEAEQDFRISVVLAPGSPDCLFNLARVRQARGKTGQALADYDRVLQLNPSSAEARLNRGLLLLEQGRRVEARADLARASSLGADPAVVSYNLALIDLADDNPSAARSELRQALDHDPNHREARALLDRLTARLSQEGR